MATVSSSLRTHTQSATIQAQPARVFDFVSDPVNLPRWAVGFATAVRPGTDGQWTVTTGHGAEIVLAVAASRDARTIDFHMSPAQGATATAYARVLPNGDGTEFVFTQLQPRGMDDATFDAQVDALRHELVALKAVMEVTCPS